MCPRFDKILPKLRKHSRPKYSKSASSNQKELITVIDVAVERETEGDLVLSDMGEGVPFRAGSFDGAVSVSAIQWLFNADKKSHKPVKRIYTFFSTLYAALVKKFF